MIKQDSLPFGYLRVYSQHLSIKVLYSLRAGDKSDRV